LRDEILHMHANTCKYLHIHTKWSDLLGHLVGRMVDSWLILESDGVLFLWSCEFQPHPVPHQQIPIEKTREGLETLGFPGDLQRRLRRLVIFCLSCVDLQDEKLSVVLDYLKELLQGLDDERRPLAERQWYRLHSRVYDVYGYGDGLCDCADGQEAKTIPTPKQLVSLHCRV